MKKNKKPSDVTAREIEELRRTEHITDEQRADAAKQLQHANEQLALTRSYPARHYPGRR